MNSENTDLDLSNVNRLYTLLLLEAGERHGYQIIKDIEKVTGKKPSTSHIYPFLEKLVQKDVATVERKGDRGKKVYRLTDEGENLVKEQLDSFGEILDAAIEGEIEQCENCGCEIYSGGYEEKDKVYCCEHCAASKAL
jgi:DNA-binding PadR family transcriptional regulator